MSFKDVKADIGPKHMRIIEAVEAKDPEEAKALRDLITGGHVSAEKVSLTIAQEMPKYTDDESLQTLSSRQIQRIRKGLIR